MGKARGTLSGMFACAGVRMRCVRLAGWLGYCVGCGVVCMGMLVGKYEFRVR